jgi:hypothetical protein
MRASNEYCSVRSLLCSWSHRGIGEMQVWIPEKP